MKSQWLRIILGMIIVLKVIVLVECDNRRPIWNIGHMVNDITQVDEFLDLGANSIEFDVTFNADGIPNYVYHGIPCDCFRYCTNWDYLASYIDYMRKLSTAGNTEYREQLVLLFMDLKISSLNWGALNTAGIRIATTLLENYWKPGVEEPQAHIVLSVPSLNSIGFIHSFSRTMESEGASKYKNKIGFDFSGNEDVDIIYSVITTENLGYQIWIGDGITNCLARGTKRLLHALSKRDEESNIHVHKVYWWTVDRRSTMRQTLRLGVDGMITNHPDRLAEVLLEEEFVNRVRLANITDNPWKKYRNPLSRLLNIVMENIDEGYQEEEVLNNIGNENEEYF